MAAKTMASLHYTFPVYDSTIEVPANVPRDVLLSQTLKLPKPLPVSDPIRSIQPINKVFNGNMLTTRCDNPLDAILKSSRKKIQTFVEQANRNELLQQQTLEGAAEPIKPPVPSRSAIKISKRKERDQSAPSNLAMINGSSSNKSTTPITNKTIYFSPSGKGKRSSTPSSMAKDIRHSSMRKSSKTLKQKLLRMDQASLVNMTNKQPTPGQFPIHNDEDAKKDNEDNEGVLEDESEYDHLACHADNIMRMAVDSTMLGSTFNSSFSSSFSNSFNNDHTGKDFFDKEAKQSILEGLNF